MHTYANIHLPDQDTRETVAKHALSCPRCVLPQRQGLLFGNVATSGEYPFVHPIIAPTTWVGLRRSIAPCGHRLESWNRESWNRELSLALLWTCRHIYHSAMPLVYRTYTFCLGSGANTYVATTFLRSLSPVQSACLRTVSLHIFVGPVSEPDQRLGIDEAFFDETWVMEDWKEVINDNDTSDLRGLAGLPGLQKLIIELRWKPQIDMWLPSEDNFIPTALKFLPCFEGIKGLGLSELQIILWELCRRDGEMEEWERRMAFEEGIRMRLLGFDGEEGMPKETETIALKNYDVNYSPAL